MMPSSSRRRMVAHGTATDLQDIDSKRISMLEEVPERNGDSLEQISLCVWVPVYTQGG